MCVCVCVRARARARSNSGVVPGIVAIAICFFITPYIINAHHCITIVYRVLSNLLVITFWLFTTSSQYRGDIFFNSSAPSRVSVYFNQINSYIFATEHTFCVEKRRIIFNLS